MRRCNRRIDIEEIWKDVPENTAYQVSNHGNVKSKTRLIMHPSAPNGLTRKGKVLKATVNGCGYLQVDLYNDGIARSVRVHRLVAENFVDGRFEGAVVNHKDGVKTNCMHTNLEWTTSSDNSIHSYRNNLTTNQMTSHRDNKLSVEDVLNIRTSSVSAKELASLYDVHVQTIYSIRQNKTWKSLN